MVAAALERPRDACQHHPAGARLLPRRGRRWRPLLAVPRRLAQRRQVVPPRVLRMMSSLGARHRALGYKRVSGAIFTGLNKDARLESRASSYVTFFNRYFAVILTVTFGNRPCAAPHDDCEMLAL